MQDIMISYSEIKKGVVIVINGDPCEVFESSLLFKGRGHSVLQARIKNLASGEIISKNFQPADSFKEAEIEKVDLKFIYSHNNKFVFCLADNPSKRIEISAEAIGQQSRFLKSNEIVKGLSFCEKIINISLPIKVNLKVIESPPGIKADRAEAGNKRIKLETGTEINAPLFIKEGDILEINTETGEYVKRL